MNIQRICNKCDQELDLLAWYSKDKRGPAGRSRTCKSCIKAIKVKRQLRGVQNHVVSVDTRKTTPCRHCLKLLPLEKYQYVNSWYCLDCVAVRKYQKRASSLPKLCKICNTLTPSSEMLITDDRCIICANATRTKPVRKSYSQSKQAIRKRKYRRDPIKRSVDNIRSRVANSLANCSISMRTQDVLGCSYQQFLDHIESQFVQGMNWNNRDDWHLDHIIPCSYAQCKQEILLLNHYTNFQPLWAAENQNKSATITEQARNHPLYVRLQLLRKQP